VAPAIFAMRKMLFTGVFLIALAARAEAPRDLPHATVVAPPSEVADLARGYSRAYSSLAHTPVTLAFERGGALHVLADVRSVKDADGVVIVQLGTGLVWVLNPRDIVYLTDDAPPKAKS
jgi:hypothetical protein